MRRETMTGFELFLTAAGRGNPANALGAASNTPRVGGPWPRPAGAEIVGQVAKTKGYEEALHSRPEDGAIGPRLARWAAVEALNRGSYMRAKPPLPVERLGSGRWEASDRGGLWHVLRDDAVAWLDLPQEGRMAWERAAAALSIRRAALSVWIAPAGGGVGPGTWHGRIWRARAAAARGDNSGDFVVVAHRDAVPEDRALGQHVRQGEAWLVWDGTRAEDDPCGYGRLWVIEEGPAGRCRVSPQLEGHAPHPRFADAFPVSVGPEGDEAWVIVPETGVLICP